MQLITERGASDVPLRAIAAPLGVTHAAIKHHFPSRQSLLAGVAAEAFAQLEQSLRCVAQRLDEPRQALLSTCLEYVSFGLKRPNLYRAMYAPELAEYVEAVEAGYVGDDPMVFALVGQKGTAFGCFVDLIRHGQHRGAFRDGSAADLARLATALSHGLVSEFIDEFVAKHGDQQAHARAVFHLMLTGLEHRG